MVVGASYMTSARRRSDRLGLSTEPPPSRITSAGSRIGVTGTLTNEHHNTPSASAHSLDACEAVGE